jgi:fumarate hydratase subunit beta
MDKTLVLPLSDETADALNAGDRVRISGTIYTARDAAHKRMVEEWETQGILPFPMEGATIYYAGPCPAKPGEIIGSIGPTTSGRMDAYTPTLLDLGLKAMIGKGNRTPQVVDAMIRNKAVYFAAVGGAGALLKQAVLSAEVVAYEDLGTEAIRALVVKDFPAIVVVDTRGSNLYETEPIKYEKSLEDGTWA